jgi:dipeptidyl aminopeptidase/acylaminoacyl peptidase
MTEPPRTAQADLERLIRTHSLPPSTRDRVRASLAPLASFPLMDVRDQIFLADADGSNVRPVDLDGDNRWPTWSPDGSRIAFVHDGVLATMAADGTDVQLIDGVRPEGSIAWNPVP